MLRVLYVDKNEHIELEKSTQNGYPIYMFILKPIGENVLLSVTCFFLKPIGENILFARCTCTQ